VFAAAKTARRERVFETGFRQPARRNHKLASGLLPARYSQCSFCADRKLGEGAMGSRLSGARMTDARVYPAAVYITTKTLTRFTTRVFSAPHGHVDALGKFRAAITGCHARPSDSE
jgi:hypothetical protein